MDEFHHSGSALASLESLTTIAMRSTLAAESGPFQIFEIPTLEEIWAGPCGMDEKT
jgi:hypothetical protein